MKTAAKQNATNIPSNTLNTLQFQLFSQRLYFYELEPVKVKLYEVRVPCFDIHLTFNEYPAVK